MASLEVYAEIGTGGGCLLFTFDPPGLLARGEALDRALAAGSEETARLRQFLEACGCLDLLAEPWAGSESPRLVVAETVLRRGTCLRGGTRATFKRDHDPVRPAEIPRFLTLLRRLRTTLWALKDRIPAEAYRFRSEPRRMTIGEQLRHIARCDLWYFSRFWDDVPSFPRTRDPWERLTICREAALARLGSMSREDMKAARKIDHEVWTARKLFRRYMYHEKFHRETVERDLALFLACRPSDGPSSP